MLTPDELFAGVRPASPVLVYDDDHYVLGALLAEQLAKDGLEVHYLTPADKVSVWTELTMEQPRIQARLMRLGVTLHLAREITDVTSGPQGLRVTLSSVYLPTQEALQVASLLPVTMRDPDDTLAQALQARQPQWAEAGIKSVQVLGDALAPGTVAAAVYAGHRAARELGGPVTEGVGFRRERVGLED